MTVRIGGFDTAAVTRAALARIMVEDALAARDSPDACLPKVVFSSNGQGISLAARNQEFREAMARADLIHADGMSVVFASRLLAGLALPERVATTDFFHDAAAAAQEVGLRFFMLGGTDRENLAACTAAQRLYPKLEVVGRYHGYFTASQNTSVCEMVISSGADVLWVALGRPKQEFWSLANRERLRGVAWIKTCGGLYAFLAGTAPRAPLWMQNAGMEWFFRLMHEPSRLALRYLATNPHAIWRVIVDSRPAVPRSGFHVSTVKRPFGSEELQSRTTGATHRSV
jgi:exopolysaccharide biosynthesis WecB/TagA/CpsF family protein